MDPAGRSRGSGAPPATVTVVPPAGTSVGLPASPKGRSVASAGPLARPTSTAGVADAAAEDPHTCRAARGCAEVVGQRAQGEVGEQTTDGHRACRAGEDLDARGQLRRRRPGPSRQPGG